MNLLGDTADQLIRTGEPVFRELGLSKTDELSINATNMHENPILIERPVVITQKSGGHWQAARGRFENIGLICRT